MRGREVSEGLGSLPSVFTPIVALHEGDDAMACAVELAPVHGAGTLAWVRSRTRIAAAAVLEPEEALAVARPALLAAMAAFADAIGALGPPEIPLLFDWPSTVRVNGAVVGRAQLAAPPHCAEAEVPDWVVVGVEAAFADPSAVEPGRDPSRTTLFDEGWGETTPAEITAAWARHLMATLADWQARGFPALAGRYLPRLDPALGAGARRGLDPASGDLVIERGGARERLPLSGTVPA